MNQLFRVTMTHYSPKDSESGVAAYVVGSEDDVIAWLATQNYGAFDGWEKDGDTGEFCPDEGWKALRPNWQSEAEAAGLEVDEYDDISGPKMALFRFCRGDFEEPEDRYYGVTHHRWESLGAISDDDAATLARLGITTAPKEPT